MVCCDKHNLLECLSIVSSVAYNGAIVWTAGEFEITLQRNGRHFVKTLDFLQ